MNPIIVEVGVQSPNVHFPKGYHCINEDFSIEFDNKRYLCSIASIAYWNEIEPDLGVLDEGVLEFSSHKDDNFDGDFYIAIEAREMGLDEIRRAAYFACAHLGLEKYELKVPEAPSNIMEEFEKDKPLIDDLKSGKIIPEFRVTEGFVKDWKKNIGELPEGLKNVKIYPDEEKKFPESEESEN